MACTARAPLPTLVKGAWMPLRRGGPPQDAAALDTIAWSAAHCLQRQDMKLRCRVALHNRERAVAVPTWPRGSAHWLAGCTRGPAIAHRSFPCDRPCDQTQPHALPPVLTSLVGCDRWGAPLADQRCRRLWIVYGPLSGRPSRPEACCRPPPVAVTARRTPRLLLPQGTAAAEASSQCSSRLRH